MNNPLRKPKAIRAFPGLVGRESASVKKPAPPSKPDVLVHFCHDQERSEPKPDRCDCTLHIFRSRAYELTAAGQADFLLAKNPKTKKLTKFHRGIVMRRTIVAGEILFSLDKPVKPNRRDVKHEIYKSQIKLAARRILQKLLAAGTISPEIAKISDVNLADALQHPEKFLENIPARKNMQGYWRDLAIRWWGNVLGFHRLSTDAGRFLNDADKGTGLVVTGTKEDDSDSARLGRIAGAAETDTGKVTGGSGRASHWSGGWDFSVGTDPQAFEAGEIDEK